MVVQVAPMTQQMVEVRHLLPNPFRRIQHYPTDELKVERLIESYQQTGYWGNIVGRRINSIWFEIAYGHHRKIAIERTFNASDKVPLIVRNLTDAQMLLMMANENMSDFSASFIVDLETVYSVILAFGQGQITLRPLTRKEESTLREIRCAPSFIPGNLFSGGKHYSPQTLADFLGWLVKGRDGQAVPARRINTALLALEYIEQGYLKESDFAELSAKATEDILRVAEQRRREHEERAKLFDAQARNRAAEAKQARAEAELAKAEAKAAQDEAQRKAKRLEAAQRKRQELEAHRAQRKAQRGAITERQTGKEKAATVAREVARKRRDPLTQAVQIREEANRIAPLREDSKEAFRIQKLEINRQADDIASEIWGILNDKPNPPRLPDPLALKIRQIAADAHYLTGSTEKLTRIISALTQLVSRAEELVAVLDQAKEKAAKPAASTRPLLKGRTPIT